MDVELRRTVKTLIDARKCVSMVELAMMFFQNNFTKIFYENFFENVQSEFSVQSMTKNLSGFSFFLGGFCFSVVTPNTPIGSNRIASKDWVPGSVRLFTKL